MSKLVLGILLLTISCGRQEATERPPTHEENPELAKIKDRLSYLELLSGEITDVTTSEFKTCADAGALQGKELAKKICQIAQAATNEQMIELSAKLQTLNGKLDENIDALDARLQALDTRLSTAESDIDDVQADILTIESDISDLEDALADLDTRLDDAEADITSILSDLSDLQDQLEDVVDDLDTAMAVVEIGTENPVAGPIYENALRQIDKAIIVMYTEQFGAQQSITGCTASSGSATVSCNTSAAHGWVTNDFVYLVGIAGGRGLSASDLSGDFQVTVVDSDTFTFQALHSATGNGGLGGTSGLGKKVIGRGMRKIYDQSTNNSDVTVRQTSVGTRRYNFMIKETSSQGFICYDKSNAAATFSTINTGATTGACTGVGACTNGNVVCK